MTGSSNYPMARTALLTLQRKSIKRLVFSQFLFIHFCNCCSARDTRPQNLTKRVVLKKIHSGYTESFISGEFDYPDLHPVCGWTKSFVIKDCSVIFLRVRPLPLARLYTQTIHLFCNTVLNVRNYCYPWTNLNLLEV